jgi:hypothetical protein
VGFVVPRPDGVGGVLDGAAAGVQNVEEFVAVEAGGGTGGMVVSGMRLFSRLLSTIGFFRRVHGKSWDKIAGVYTRDGSNRIIGTDGKKMNRQDAKSAKETRYGAARKSVSNPHQHLPSL